MAEETPDVPTITRSELKERMESGEDLTLVETLPPEEYEEFHLPGAVNLPPGEAREMAPSVLPDRDARIVVYCANEDCPASSRTADLLREMGYEDVVDYEGGKEDWREAGLEVETGASGITA